MVWLGANLRNPQNAILLSLLLPTGPPAQVELRMELCLLVFILTWLILAKEITYKN